MRASPNKLPPNIYVPFPEGVKHIPLRARRKAGSFLCPRPSGEDVGKAKMVTRAGRGLQSHFACRDGVGDIGRESYDENIVGKSAQRVVYRHEEVWGAHPAGSRMSPQKGIVDS